MGACSILAQRAVVPRQAMAESDRSEGRWVRRTFGLLVTLIGLWLLYSLVVVNVEFDDGYATIVNSQYFLGISGDYIWSRAPMMAWLLMPAEWSASALGLHPLDVRPHHVQMVVLHFAYLFAVWHMLRTRFGCRWPTLIAFAAAIPTVVYFCYAPFISHDVLPGLVVLVMLQMADRHANRPSLRIWLGLVAMGAAVALIKHMYGAIWVAILIAYACLAVIDRSRAGWIHLLHLAAAAACSGVIFWVAFAAVLDTSFPDTPLLLRPLKQMNAVLAFFQNEGPISEIIYQWVYIRNLSIYGVLAMALVLPGIVLSWRSGVRFQRAAAVVWIILFAIMNLVSFKEARYLAYLAPLTAILIVPVISSLLSWRRLYALPIVVVLAIDLAFGAREASRLIHPFYHDQVKEFLAELPRADQLQSAVVMTWPLSFVAPEKHAFYGDRYHRIINISDDQIRLLYGYPRAVLQRPSDMRTLSNSDFAPDDFLIFVNDVAARVPPIAEDNRTTLQPFFLQLMAVAENVTLRRDGDDYRLPQPSPQPIMLLHADGVDATPLMAFDRFPALATSASQGLTTPPDELSLLAFRIYALCNLAGCSRY